MKKHITILIIIIAVLCISIYNKFKIPTQQMHFENFNPNNLSISQQQYSRFSGDQTQLSGLLAGTGNLDIWTFLHIPTGKYSTLYLSGNSEVWVLILENTGIKASLNPNVLTEDILQSFYKASKYPSIVTSTLVAGDRGEGTSILELPYRRNRPNSTTLVAFLSKKGDQIFRELSKKEILLINKNGIVEKYIKGSNYHPDYAGMDVEGAHTMPIGGLKSNIYPINIDQF